MDDNRLAQIVESKKARLEQLKKMIPHRRRADLCGTNTLIKTRSFYNALDRDDRLNLIAEIKKASPAKGCCGKSMILWRLRSTMNHMAQPRFRF